MERDVAWKKYDEADLEALEHLAAEYIDFISDNKTERECAASAVALAEEHGYLPLDQAVREGRTLKAGDKVWAQAHGKALILAHLGQKPLEQGLNILGAHIDSPRLDLKQNPLYESNGFTLFDTHYYGGIKNYQWVTLPLALHGVIAKKDGTVVDVQVGDDPDDPVFCVTDLLVHLAGKQMAKKANEVVEGEDLDILMGNRPLTCGGGSLDGTQSLGSPGSHGRSAGLSGSCGTRLVGAAEPLAAVSEMHGVPTYMWHLVGEGVFILFRHLGYHARQHCQAAGVVGRGFVVLARRAFDAFFEQEVHSQADAEERHAGGYALADGVHLAELAHGGGRVGERANAGQHDGIGFGDGGGIARDEHLGARRDQTALDAFEVALMIVDHGDHSAPFVEGSASPMRGSSSTAWRKARAAALNDASTIWCAFSPARLRTCSVSPAFAAKAMKNSLASDASNVPSMTQGTSTAQCSWPRPDMSTAASTRASSMGSESDPNRAMPRLSPSARATAWPSTMPASSTVWCASTSISPFARTSRSIRLCLPKAVSIWSKNGTPVSMSVAPAPSRFTATRMSVSFVVRTISAVLWFMVGLSLSLVQQRQRGFPWCPRSWGGRGRSAPRRKSP